jgi:hypothetical protein
MLKLKPNKKSQSRPEWSRSAGCQSKRKRSVR